MEQRYIQYQTFTFFTFKMRSSYATRNHVGFSHAAETGTGQGPKFRTRGLFAFPRWLTFLATSTENLSRNVSRIQLIGPSRVFLCECVCLVRRTFVTRRDDANIRFQFDC